MIIRMLVMAQLLSFVVFGAQTPQTADQTSAPKPGLTQPSGEGDILEDGLPVKLRLKTAISSGAAKEGQEIIFEVVDDIDIRGVTVLRRGSAATGVVTEAAAKRRLGRGGKLNFSITYVPLADGEHAPVRSVNNSKGESHVDGMVALMANMPVAAAPFFLLLKGADTTFPKGTEITAFIDGDMRLDLSRFPGAEQASAKEVIKVMLSIESTPSGAEIEVDGKPSGTSPASMELTVGNHTVSLNKEGFRSWTTTIEVTEGSPKVSAQLMQKDEN